MHFTLIFLVVSTNISNYIQLYICFSKINIKTYMELLYSLIQLRIILYVEIKISKYYSVKCKNF